MERSNHQSCQCQCICRNNKELKRKVKRSIIKRVNLNVKIKTNSQSKNFFSHKMAKSLQKQNIKTYNKVHKLLKNMDIKKKVDLIVKYLISVTLKDCSIFITMKNFDVSNKADSGLKYVSMDGHNIMYKVTVTDLDLKPISKILYHYNLNKQIMDTSTES